MKKFLSATSFAKIIGKDPKTVISWIKKGFIKDARKVGKLYQIPAQEVERAATAKVYPNEGFSKNMPNK